MNFFKQKKLSSVDHSSELGEDKTLLNDGRTKCKSVEGDEESSRDKDDTKDVAVTQGYQCKPDLSCWNFLPPKVKEKWDKLKK